MPANDKNLIDRRPTGRVEVLSDGTQVFVRPIRVDDRALERSFIEGLSDEARRFRFLDTMTSPSPALLTQLTVIDAATDVAFVALLVPVKSTSAPPSGIGVARFSARSDGLDCEFAIAVGDAWQTKGLGTLLMRCLIKEARARRIKEMVAISASDNDGMRKLATRLGFERTRDLDEGAQVVYRMKLRSPVDP